MGKKNKQKKVSAVGKPTVSICTPTFNRREFIPQLIECVKNQSYPKQLIEWIVVDDGADSVEDLFKDVDFVTMKYFRIEEKMKLGKKRNFMNEKATGDILVYMDDDDFYPPERINHAVNKLRAKPKILVAGSSEVHIYFKDIETIYRFGPYMSTHATAATLAFKRELLQFTKYDDEAEKAEEAQFLKEFSIPMIQLDSTKTILVLAHSFNTVDKRKLLENQNPQFVKKTQMKVKKFIKNKKLREFYTKI
jgi:glycosyltransferase involved in cell wall biosynthesis